MFKVKNQLNITHVKITVSLNERFWHFVITWIFETLSFLEWCPTFNGLSLCLITKKMLLFKYVVFMPKTYLKYWPTKNSITELTLLHFSQSILSAFFRNLWWSLWFLKWLLSLQIFPQSGQRKLSSSLWERLPNCLISSLFWGSESGKSFLKYLWWSMWFR